MMMNNRTSRRSNIFAWLVWIILVAAIGGYTYHCNEKSKETRRKNIAMWKKSYQDNLQNIAEMVIRTNAIYDWKEKLYGDYISNNPFFTYELENLWIQQAPILFTGDIKDVTTYDHEHYLVILQGDEFVFWWPDKKALQLSLITKKDLIDSFFNEHPDVFDFKLFNDCIAVVASINSIRTIYEPRDVGHEERDIVHVEIKVGDGELIEIIQITSDVSSSMFITDLRKIINENKTSF